MPPKTKRVESKVPKFYRDVLAYRQLVEAGQEQWPGANSPVCKKCGLDACGASRPYMEPAGSSNPLITFVFDGPSRKEDIAGAGQDGPPGFIRKVAAKLVEKLGVSLDDFRFSPATRCAIVSGKGNPATGGKWCRMHLVEDLATNRPRMIVPIGSAVLGLLSHKSNAQDWGGRVLTYRGWPDPWLVDPKFDAGHPIYGQPPGSESYIPMVPLQVPKYVWGSRNPKAIAKWMEGLEKAITLARDGVPALSYDRPWWKLTDDPAEVEAALDELIANPGTIVTYDTETTGLKPFLGEKIVFMMIRWVAADGTIKSLGWPWDYSADMKPAALPPDVEYSTSPMLPYLSRLAPRILKALSVSKLRGHNLTFDLLFTIATVEGGLQYLDRLCEAFYEDTWHMRYTLRQERGSIGLEILAYDWAPSLAGYEEEMSMLIEKMPWLLHPKEGGHYANCPRQYWQTKFRPYVMGDVEVCAEAADSIATQLRSTRQYEIPLAHPTERGRFRRYKTVNRHTVYRNIISPAAGMLSKMMARGMFVDKEELTRQEQIYPTLIREAKDKLRNSDDRLKRWCAANEAADPEWTFDLQDAALLKEALFSVLDLPVRSLTETGTKRFKSLEGVPKSELIPYAATDKFTLNSLSVQHPEVRALLDYRSKHKQYTSYVRPLRNIMTPGIDKREATRDPILMLDGCVHTNFGIAATRGGRLTSCVDGKTVLDILVGGQSKSLHIEQLEIRNDQPVYILTHEYRYRRIIRKIVKDPAEMFKVLTSSGREITCTAGHRFLTRSGWKYLRDISVGDSVKIDTGFGRRRGIGRAGLPAHAGLLARTEGARSVHAQTDAKYVRALRPNSAGIESPAQSNSRGKSVRQAKVQYQRLPASIGYFTSRGTRKVNTRWNVVCGIGATLRRIGFYSGKKPAVVLSSGSDALFRPGWLYNRNAGSKVGDSTSRNYAQFQELRRRQSPVSQGSVPGVLINTSAGVVDSRFLPLHRNDQLGARHARGAERDMLEDKPGRSLPGARADGARNSICSRVSVPGEAASGFCDNRYEHSNRSGRRSSQGHDAEGCPEGRRIGGDGPHGAQIHLGESVGIDAGRVSADPGDDEEAVVSIRSVGVRTVFDIEVEEDASYLAHGFVNHNSSPNLQQLPRDGMIKRQFVSRFGNRGCIYQADLSQIELRLLAAACGDPTMVKAYLDGIDLHSLTTSLVFKIPYEQFTKDYARWLQESGRGGEVKKLEGKRKIGKTLNFLTGYGGGAMGFQSALALQGVYIELEECERHLEGFFETYPFLKIHIGHYKNFILNAGRAVSITGRVRIFDEVFGDDKGQLNKALRAGYNHLIQSSSSDYMLLAMVAIERLMRAEGLESILVSTVHDSLAIDAIRAELPKVHAIVDEVLSNIPEVVSTLIGPDFDPSWSIVPLSYDSEFGKNYLDSVKIPPGATQDWDRLGHLAFSS